MTPEAKWPEAAAILTIAEVQAATDQFNRGSLNVFEALDRIVAAVETYLATRPGLGEAA